MIRSLHVGRGVAALLVVLFHFSGILALPKYFGTSANSLQYFFRFGGVVGVDFFFVLSGFIIFFAHNKDISRAASLLSYIRKRVVRIYPLYFFVFISIYILGTIIPSLATRELPTGFSFVESLLLFPQYSGVPGGRSAPVLVVAWSLQYEVFFYCAFGIAVASRRAGAILGFILAVGCFLSFDQHQTKFPWSFIFNYRLLMFGVGMAAASWCTRSVFHRNQHRLPMLLGIIGLGCVGTQLPRTGEPSCALELMFACTLALIVAGLAELELRKKWTPQARGFMQLGDCSYALYLIHVPLFKLLYKLATTISPGKIGGVYAAFFAYTATSVAMGMLVHRFIEVPLLNRLKPKKHTAESTS